MKVAARLSLLFCNVKLNEIQQVIFTSEPIDLAALLFGKMGKVDYIV